MIGRVYYSVREGDYVVDLDDSNGWTFATAAEAEHFAEVFRSAVRYHAEVEREECAALVLAAAEEYATRQPGDDAHDLDRNRHAADVLRAVAEDILARGSQEPPQRPEAPGDVATPAPDAPSPAGGLPVAAAGDDAAGHAYERGRLAGLDEAAAVVRAEADARAGQRGALSQHDVVACDRTVGALRRVAYAVERAKALVSATKGGE